jgi:hypothetical protein
MITFERLHPAHIRFIEVQTVQTGELSHVITPEAAEALSAHHGLSAWQSGVCLAAAGFIPQWPGRATCWALLSRHVGRGVVSIVRRMTAEVETYNEHCARIEMQVRHNFEQGHRLALMLGFAVETDFAPKFFPDGAGAKLYARLR